MTRTEFRQSKEYAECMRKITGYPKGFTFTIPYYKMTTGQKNAMDAVTSDAIKEGLLESISMGYSLSPLEMTEETFKRL